MISARRRLLAGLLVLAAAAQLARSDEGDECQVKADIPGVCRASSACRNIEGYLRSGRLSTSQVPSCGFGAREEIICCPTVACCPTDRAPEVQVLATSSERSRLPKREPDPEPLPPTTTDLKRERESRLDENHNFFDFNKLLSTTVKPQRTHESLKVPTQESAKVSTHESMKMPTQSVGGWGTAPTEKMWTATTQRSWMEPQWSWDDREPRVVNRPLTTPRSRQPKPLNPNPSANNNNLINLVNGRLRQQGMQIEPALAVPMETQVLATTTPTPTPTPKKVMDPFEPFKFRGEERQKEPQPEPWNEPSNDLDEELSPSSLTPAESRTTTSSTVRPVTSSTSSTRVSVPERDRPAVAACAKIQSGNRPLTPHILGGTAVEAGEYPHMAAIAFSPFGQVKFLCGGSLIASRYVLTAAHCVDSYSPVFVRLGALDIENPEPGFQDINVIDVQIHPNYSGSAKYNDIAILELAEDAKESDNIRPACLYTDRTSPPGNSSLFVAGWGVMNVTSRAVSKTLQRASLVLVPVDECNASFSEYPSAIRALKYGVTESLLCAGDKMQVKDACQGDSGGPLILETDKVNGLYSVLGIIASGMGCATKTPGLYTRVSSFLDYIEGIVWPANRVRGRVIDLQ